MSPHVWHWLDSLHGRSQVWFCWAEEFLFAFLFAILPGGKRPKHVKLSGVGTNSVSGVKNICWNSCFPLFRSPNAAALQGTSCGEGRHCIGGLCVPKTSPLGGSDSGSGGTFWESFSGGTVARSSTTGDTRSSTTATSLSTSATSEPGRVVYFPKAFDICQFFAQFGISLKNICQRWHHFMLAPPTERISRQTLSASFKTYICLKPSPIKHIKLLPLSCPDFLWSNIYQQHHSRKSSSWPESSCSCHSHFLTSRPSAMKPLCGS